MILATYNIHFGLGADGKYDVARIADTVAQADIICVQEAVAGWSLNGYADQTAEIAARLNRYCWYHGAMEADSSSVAADGRIDNRRRSFGNAVISRWPIRWARGHYLPKNRLLQTFDLQRGFVEAGIDTPSGPLRVHSVHLSHVGAQQRLPQVRALMEIVQAAPRTGSTWDGTASERFVFQEPAPIVPAAAIVAGDFNFTAADPEYPAMCGEPSAHYGRLATTAHLLDAWTLAGNDETTESFRGEGRIDHVMVTPELAGRVKRAWIDSETVASDHQPIFVEFAG